ncbi:hypothetical protein BGZ63DRAFT_444932 [Mariannaea sp. PMI_226]|nr:hypothetical protein BGZ63DRAFT_444932 [Mariannaea sp. PMI_226]
MYQGGRGSIKGEMKEKIGKHEQYMEQSTQNTTVAIINGDPAQHAELNSFDLERCQGSYAVTTAGDHDSPTSGYGYDFEDLEYCAEDEDDDEDDEKDENDGNGGDSSSLTTHSDGSPKKRLRQPEPGDGVGNLNSKNTKRQRLTPSWLFGFTSDFETKSWAKGTYYLTQSLGI